MEPLAALPALALLPAALFASLAAWRLRQLRFPAVRAEGRVTLILPVAGRALGSVKNLGHAACLSLADWPG